ncbi:prepilin-type N-terminal cleavage/methylation domain-containing protein [Candidatus Roizmanbacteria bacterium]|nr:prepilin-type N-terminal cleavage/methylation domain-containing protein [Candidatus Roizmanbacteria bacterium]
MRSKKSHKGYTLAELLISISIIALITSSTVVGFANTLRRSRDIKRLADMEGINTALDSFYADNGRYPGPQDGIPVCGQYIGVGDLGNTAGSCASNLVGSRSIDTILAPYMGDVPHDPLHDSAENDSSDGYDTEYYYAYDSWHNVSSDCVNVTDIGAVFGFFQSETQAPNIEPETCSGADMQLDNFDFNRALLPGNSGS